MEAEKGYFAFLRGINVSGHHKVPMADLRREMENLGFNNVQTLLNSGNVAFRSRPKKVSDLEHEINLHLREIFDFDIPVIVTSAELIKILVDQNPFHNVNITPDIRLYITLLKDAPVNNIKLPWHTEDYSFSIIEIREIFVCSVLDLSKTKTVKGMEILEKTYGKNVTTRNWNTILKIAALEYH